MSPELNAGTLGVYFTLYNILLLLLPFLLGSSAFLKLNGRLSISIHQFLSIDFKFDLVPTYIIPIM